MTPTRIGSRRIDVVVFLAAGMVVGGSALADTEADARKHAGKANQLAAKNKCKAAIFEFTRALKTLKDPGLLFNRAECFRKVGRSDEAIADYEEFLVEMPQAPNRAAVETHVAALRASSGGGGDAAASAAASAPSKDTAPGKEPTATAKPPAASAPAPLPKTADSASAEPAAAPAAPGPAGPPPAPPAPPTKADEKQTKAEEKPAPARKVEKWGD